ncbi:heavy-metal-associated domain-containing protein [Flavobacterium sp. NG2]|uniref:heavy-metal-associated domain-containing protein n=1 Tax=Flavobacterium sp. NG2 TaxID=3097547 RepID=UPI002A803591|nr:heavy-metal-associated domain-containing protein [Flavobacterium sp. NG2]WPR71443.1 heavy-metal-associated domain-containing protein [Flavobacterium sp. NG2]
MSIITNNIIPGNHGRVFGTNAKEDVDLETIETKLLEIDGIKEVAINKNIFPREFTVYSTKIIDIREVETKVKSAGFHAIPKENLDI